MPSIFKLPTDNRDYKSVYEQQERYFARQRIQNNILTAVATLLPPVSLLFSLPVLAHYLKNSKESNAIDIKNSYKSFMFMALLAAVLPIFSGFFSKKISDSNQQFAQDTAPVQKRTYSNEVFAQHKENRRLYKSHHYIDTTVLKSSPHKKPAKLVVDSEEGKDVYMDTAQVRRWENIEHYAKNPWQPQPIGFFYNAPIQEKPTYNPQIDQSYYHDVDASQRLLLDLPTLDVPQARI